MATKRGLTTDYQSAGFGWLSFNADNNFANLPMSYEQRLWQLESLYCFAIAKAEAEGRLRADTEEGKSLLALVEELKKRLDQAGRDYRAEYENHDTFNQAENNYRTLLVRIFEKITELQGKLKMMEREVMKMEEIG